MVSQLISSFAPHVIDPNKEITQITKNSLLERDIHSLNREQITKNLQHNALLTLSCCALSVISFRLIVFRQRNLASLQVN